MARRWGGQTVAERRAGRRGKLIEAAIALYGVQGFRSTGVKAVCQAAGLTERYFYESFANSEALLAAAFDHVVALLTEAIRAADAGALPAEARVRAMLATYYGMLREHPAATRVFLVEITGVNAAIDAAFEASLLQLTEPLLEACDPARAGPLATEPLLRRGAAGGLLHIALAWSDGGFAEPVARVVEAGARLWGMGR